MTRVLFLHIGMGRTGSSALQVAFARSASRLRQQGINYRTNWNVWRARAGRVTAGNGAALFHELFPELLRKSAYREDKARRAFQSYFGGARHLGGLITSRSYDKALISSELFSSMDDVAWQRLRALAAGIDVRVIAVVRNVLPALLSAHGRHVGRGITSQSFEDYVMPRPGLYLSGPALRRAVDTFGRDACTVIHYDTDRQNLAERMFNALGLAVPEGRPVPSINSWPGKGSLTPEGRAILENRYTPDVEWLNQTFFGGKEVVRFD